MGEWTDALPYLSIYSNISIYNLSCNPKVNCGRKPALPSDSPPPPPLPIHPSIPFHTQTYLKASNLLQTLLSDWVRLWCRRLTCLNCMYICMHIHIPHTYYITQQTLFGQTLLIVCWPISAWTCKNHFFPNMQLKLVSLLLIHFRFFYVLTLYKFISGKCVRLCDRTVLIILESYSKNSSSGY